MLFGLVLEMIYGLGIGNLVASVLGFATLLIAHFLASTGDTLIVLQAVLDTQFWLATHVVCVTLGYAATFVTGLLGIAYIFHAANPAGRSGRWAAPSLASCMARSASAFSSALSAPCWAGYGPTIRGAVFGAGIPRKTGP